MFHASQESAQIARNQVTHLSEEVASLQTQLNAANAALRAVDAGGGGGGGGGSNTLHRSPAPRGGGGNVSGGARILRSRLARKTTGEAERQSPAEVRL